MTCAVVWIWTAPGRLLCLDSGSLADGALGKVVKALGGGVLLEWVTRGGS